MKYSPHPVFLSEQEVALRMKVALLYRQTLKCPSPKRQAHSSGLDGFIKGHHEPGEPGFLET